MARRHENWAARKLPDYLADALFVLIGLDVLENVFGPYLTDVLSGVVIGAATACSAILFAIGKRWRVFGFCVLFVYGTRLAIGVFYHLLCD